MATDMRAANAIWRADLGRGAAAGGGVGAVLGVLTVVMDFPEWSLVTWGFLLAFSAVFLVALLVWRAAVLGGLKYLNGGVEEIVTPVDGMSMFRFMDVGTAAMVVATLVLSAFWWVGDGRAFPF